MYGGSNKHCYETTDLSHGIAATSVRLSGRWRRGLIVTACGPQGNDSGRCLLCSTHLELALPAFTDSLSAGRSDSGGLGRGQ